MRKAVVIVGANYGDEGKGLAAYSIAKNMTGKVLNILINGGAQRGHTVDLPDGRRHVFHHFGSAALSGADSFADEDFIVNPPVFAAEREELRRDLGIEPKLLIAAKCRVSTPYDMILGQIIEENRGSRRHGSCGLGIFETVTRFKHTDWALDWEALSKTDPDGYRCYCERIRDQYIPARLAQLGMQLDEAWREILYDGRLTENSYLDAKEAFAATRIAPVWPEVAKAYDGFVFEAGQGLMLDEDNKADHPHLTPSHTTSLVSAQRIRQMGGEAQSEIIYVTRSYFTRHGAGPFPGECPKAEINPDMEDRTNVPNPHQQVLRYGRFDTVRLLERTKRDFARSKQLLPEAENALFVTHLNETGGRLAGTGELEDVLSQFDRGYISYTPCEMKRLR